MPEDVVKRREEFRDFCLRHQGHLMTKKVLVRPGGGRTVAPIPYADGFVGGVAGEVYVHDPQRVVVQFFPTALGADFRVVHLDDTFEISLLDLIGCAILELDGDERMGVVRRTLADLGGALDVAQTCETESLGAALGLARDLCTLAVDQTTD